MSAKEKAEVGDWFQRSDTGEVFQVVSLDAASVQVQSFDGQLDSIETEDWEELPLIAAAEPEDWTGPLDELEPDDVTEDDSPSDRVS
jgi:hypothetical protein